VNLGNLKYLVIGSSGHQYVDCIEWGDDLPNIVDYHVVIVNVRSLDSETLKIIPNEIFEKIRKLLTRFLHSNGSLVIMTDFHRIDKRPKQYPDSASNYSWSPIDIGIKSESGDTINIIEDRFPKYFSLFKKWSYYLYIPQNALSRELTAYVGDTFSHRYRLPINNFIENRYSRTLSGEIHFEVTRQLKTEYRQSYYPENPDNVFGQIVLLPLLEDIEYKQAVNALLEDLIGKPQITLPPDWTETIKIPLVEDIDIQLNDEVKKMGDIQDKIGLLETKKNEINSFKKLIYSDGADLENIFKTCLQKLGGKVIPAKYSQEEYILIYKNIEYPVEAKGISKSASISHLRQLIDYMLQHEDKSGEKSKGILLVNPWKNIPIDQRNINKSIPDNVLKRSKEMNISIVYSVDFFHAFCRFLECKKIGEDILNTITSASGLAEL
jgi:hypothetical protein